MPWHKASPLEASKLTQVVQEHPQLFAGLEKYANAEYEWYDEDIKNDFYNAVSALSSATSQELDAQIDSHRVRTVDLLQKDVIKNVAILCKYRPYFVHYLESFSDNLHFKPFRITKQIFHPSTSHPIGSTVWEFRPLDFVEDSVPHEALDTLARIKARYIDPDSLWICNRRTGLYSGYSDWYIPRDTREHMWGTSSEHLCMTFGRWICDIGMWNWRD